MIRSVSISRLRGIREGTLGGFGAIVILVGPNGSGKSTLLDAILLGASPVPENAIQNIVQRRQGLHHPERWLLWRAATETVEIGEVQITSDSGRTRIVELTPGNPRQSQTPFTVSHRDAAIPQAPTGFSSPKSPNGSKPFEDVPSVRLVDPYGSNQEPLYVLYTDVAERGLTREAKAIVTDLVPGLEDIQILAQENQPVVYLVYKNGARPVGLAGDGVRLLLKQSLELAAPSGGVVLLEEPEIHMHPGAIRQSALAILAAAKRGIQVILTTHSLDLIDALVASADEKTLETISLYRVQLEDGILGSYRLSGPEIALARTQIEDDLR